MAAQKPKPFFKADIAIIGAGITGCCLARELSRYNLTIAVLEKEQDVGWQTTKANSGILHAGYAGEPGSLKLKLTHQGNKIFRQNAPELDIPLKNIGSLVNASSPEGISALEQLYSQGKRQGIQKLSLLRSYSKIKDLEPAVSSQVTAALYAPDACIVSPYEAAIAAYENARANGAIFLLGFEVQGIKAGKSFILHSDSMAIESDYIINAAGIAAHRIAGMIGDHSFTINPVKGQYILLDRETEGFVSHINFPLTRGREKRSKGILVTPTIGGNTLIGPDYEPLKKIDTETTEQGLARIKNKALSWFPGIPFSQAITSFAGIRAVSDTNDFVISASATNRRFINLAGIQSPGLTCAFAIARMAIGLLQDSGLKVTPNRRFNPIRKSILKLDQSQYRANQALYKTNPGYGRIICRCEKITEAEIVEAIARGARTLDGIKFRTRAGMGRCQGGYCSLKILDILARELGLPLEELTKKGTGSKMVFGSIL